MPVASGGLGLVLWLALWAAGATAFVPGKWAGHQWVTAVSRGEGRGGTPCPAIAQDLSGELDVAVHAVQAATRLCLQVAGTMVVSPASEVPVGATVSAESAVPGKTVVKDDHTPVTALDFAIQGLIAATLEQKFPGDRFMGEEDAKDLRADAGLCEMALSLARREQLDMDQDLFLAAVDRGTQLSCEEPIGTRTWVLDPIDGTKGLVTGREYAIGLALVVDGEAIVSVMGNPSKHPDPCIMAAVKGQGLRFFDSLGPRDAPPRPHSTFDLDTWTPDEDPAGASPVPWLLSRPIARGSPLPFGPAAAPQELCCGAMVKYWAVAVGDAAGFIQFDNELNTWDHAAGVLCVQESGGCVRDAAGNPVRCFEDRTFHVDTSIICVSKESSPSVLSRLTDAVISEALLLKKMGTASSVGGGVGWNGD